MQASWSRHEAELLFCINFTRSGYVMQTFTPKTVNFLPSLSYKSCYHKCTKMSIFRSLHWKIKCNYFRISQNWALHVFNSWLISIRPDQNFYAHRNIFTQSSIMRRDVNVRIISIYLPYSNHHRICYCACNHREIE